MNPPRFQDHSSHFETIFDAALEAADPAQRVAEAVRRSPLPDGEPASVVAVGKAAAMMFEGFRQATGLHHDAVMVVPDGAPAQAWALRADHPLPGPRSTGAGEAVRAFVQRQALVAAVAGHGGFVALLSGGASALVSLPVASIPPSRYRELTDALLRSGEPISAINSVRKHCEQLKGGRLAAMSEPAWVRAYVLSDALGDDPADIASGPFSPDPSTYADAWAIVARVAPNARETLAHLDAGRRGLLAETPKPGDPVFSAVTHIIVGSNRIALDAARIASGKLGFHDPVIQWGVAGEASEVGHDLARRAIRLAATATRPTAVLVGGETTVTLRSAAGSGGRCQEMALAAALELSGCQGVAIACLATDGADGPPDPDAPAPAGAIVTGATAALARSSGVDPVAGLANHASRAVLHAAGALVRTGPTGTNVNDIAMALVYPR